MAKHMAAVGSQIMALGAQMAVGKAAGILPGGVVGGAAAQPPLAPPPPRRRSRRGRRRRSSDSRRGAGSRSRKRDRSRRGRRSHSGRGGRNRQESSSYYSDDDQDDAFDRSDQVYSGWFWQGHALPRNCSEYGKMIPTIVYKIAHILLPKKFTVASISRHPDFQKSCRHADILTGNLGTLVTSWQPWRHDTRIESRLL